MVRFAQDQSGATRVQYAWIAFLTAVVIVGAHVDAAAAR
jgi:Flp pilus assembly pilin Flp